MTAASEASAYAQATAATFGGASGMITVPHSAGLDRATPSWEAWVKVPKTTRCT